MPSPRRSHPALTALVVVLAAFLLTACQITINTGNDAKPAPTAPGTGPTGTAAGDAPAAQPTPSKAKVGSITGKAVDTQGRGIANATIEIEGVTKAGENTTLEVRTDANGSYSTKVPDGNYAVRAWFQRDYNGTRYSLGLLPVDNDQTRKDDSTKGIVKDFVWKLSGPMAFQLMKPDDVAYHYGGSLTVYGNPPGRLSPLLKLADKFTLEITLTPNGPLIDGSAGQPITLKHPYANGTLNFNPDIPDRTFIDIPLGKYTATVKAIDPNGTVHNLRVAASWKGHRAGPNDLAASTDVEFAPITVGFPGLARDVETTTLEVMQ